MTDEITATEASAALRDVLERIGQDALIGNAVRVRNVLKDMFPDRPLAASLLTTPVEHGIIGALRDQSAGVGLEILGPRLATRLADETGLSTSHATWSVATWAAAMGMAGAHPAPWPSATDSTSDERMFTSTAPRRTKPLRPEQDSGATMTLAAAPPAFRDAETVIAAAAPAAVEPRPRRRRRRWPLWTAVVVVVALVAAGASLWLVLGSAAAFTVAAGAGARGTVQAPHERAHALSAQPMSMTPGSVVTATQGPVQVLLGGSVLRLDDGASVTATSAHAVRLRSGRVWLNAVSGSSVSLTTPDGTISDSRGPLVADCTSGCRFQALDAPQSLAAASGPVRHLAAHAAISISSAGTARSAFTAPDVLTADPWISENRSLDAKQHRATPLTGGSILGDWGLTVHRSDIRIPLDRQLTVTRDCSGGTCTLDASTGQQDHSRTAVTGTVTSLDSTGDQYRIDYRYSARCAYHGVPAHPDGTESMSDVLKIRGSGSGAVVSGTRTTQYTPDKGSTCASGAYTRPIHASVSGSRNVQSVEDLRADRQRQQVVMNYARRPAGPCAPAKDGPVPGLVAEVVCPYGGSGAGGTSRPATVEFLVYAKPSDVTSAYRTLLARTGAASDSGDCTTGPCEAAVPGGRILQTGTGSSTELVTYDLRNTLLLIVSRGTSLPSMHAWWMHQGGTNGTDYTDYPIPRVGA